MSTSKRHGISIREDNNARKINEKGNEAIESKEIKGTGWGKIEFPAPNEDVSFISK